MKIKDRLLCYMLPAILLAAIAYSAKYLFHKGILSWHIKQSEYLWMIGELIILVVIISVLAFKIKNSKWLICTLGIITAFFLWIHMAFLPFVISGIYLIYLGSVGRFIRSGIFKKTDSDGEVKLILDLMVGMMAAIVGFSVLSALGVGSISQIRRLVMITFFPVVLVGFYIQRFHLRSFFERRSARINFSNMEKILLTGMILSIFLQLGRMNLTIDFDSIWYGLRTPFVLNNGNGIYENLGKIGIVYTYSKGFEVLTMPLSGLPSFGFVLAFNVWITILVIATSYQIGRKYMNVTFSVMFSFLISMTPGIMNMSTTAKSDSLTVWIQLVMIYCLIGFVERVQSDDFIYSFSALLLSWVLKPTSLVFSTAIFGSSIVYLIFRRIWCKFPSRREILFLLLPILTVLSMWIRTYMITGVPVTSVYSSVFTKIGFTLKYPFAVNQIPNTGADLTVNEKLLFFFDRIKGFFLCPVGQDMSHVILAWGSLLIFFLATVWILLWFTKRECMSKLMQDNKVLYLYIIGIPFILINLLSLYRLDQVDGNYFMLFYIFILLFGTFTVFCLREGTLQRILLKSIMVGAAYSFLIMSLTNWAWVTCFMPIRFIHNGYYNHMEGIKQTVSAEGNEEIWNYLEEDPRKRVIIVGEHPQMLLFPCSTQSYEDITGSWGNVALVKTMDRFIEFLIYAKTDYIYMQAGYMKEGTRCYELMRYLIENETLTDLMYEDGNVLARVAGAAQPGDQGQKNLIEFDQLYQLD